jgi:hypothetical protein
MTKFINYHSDDLKTGVPEDDSLPNPNTFEQHCLESAARWVLKRRANLPYLPPRRLPAVVRGV